MPGFTKYSYKNNDSLDMVNSIIQNFRGGASHPDGTQPTWFTDVVPEVNSGTARKVLLEATSAVDPIIGTDPTQKWRILIEGVVTPITVAGVTKNHVKQLKIFWGTERQIPGFDNIDPDTPFITCWTEANAPKRWTNVYAYRHTIVPRGFVIAMWTNQKVNTLNDGNTMLCIQRPVNPKTGAMKTTGTLPVFSLDVTSGRSSGQEIEMTVVREKDVNFASPKRRIGTPSFHNLYGMSMNWNHPNILSNITHVIKFPFGLCTDRHIYMEEMDLISLVQATSFIAEQKADITMYTPAQTRTYTGCFGPVNYNFNETKQILGGSRIAILTKNSGDNLVEPPIS
jgi:hypothetical protein